MPLNDTKGCREVVLRVPQLDCGMGQKHEKVLIITIDIKKSISGT